MAVCAVDTGGNALGDLATANWGCDAIAAAVIAAAVSSAPKTVLAGASF